jgi:hypothetical protein
MAWMVKNSKDERLKLVRLGPVPKTVDMEEIGGEVDKAEDAVPTSKHRSRMELDNARRVIIMITAYS